MMGDGTASDSDDGQIRLGGRDWLGAGALWRAGVVRAVA